MASFTGMVGFLPNFMLTCRMFRAEGEHWDFRAGERGPSQVYRRSGCRGNRACVRARWPTWIHEPFSRRRRLVESWDHLFAWPLYFFFLFAAASLVIRTCKDTRPTRNDSSFNFFHRYVPPSTESWEKSYSNVLKKI
jgi:hypothetical protein